ncbi:hypothetical protein HanIR_Chr08g0377871 [Helianthus annuus]|nr:hypothetical protein HanIR_Chr08g0377871 [Helianthus annuus]
MEEKLGIPNRVARVPMVAGPSPGSFFDSPGEVLVSKQPGLSSVVHFSVPRSLSSLR